jgi:hypothetical protein
MSWNSDRERGYEAQYVHGEETAFKTAARRNRLLAQWAARLLGLRHRDTARYVEQAVTGDVGHARGHAIIETVMRDLREAGIPTPREEVAAMFVQLEARAHAELAAQEARAADRSWV